MVQQFKKHQLVIFLSSLGLLQSVHAAGFQLYEQDGASIGNYHAGRAAEAPDASTAFYNPAGLIRIKNQQFVFGVDPILTDFRYSGTVLVSTLPDPTPEATVGQGGGFNAVPFLHYAAPISDKFVFGFSTDIPFGLKTDWGRTGFIQYSAVLSSVQVIDYSPVLAYAFNDKLSFGAGLDIQHMHGDFTQTATGFSTANNTFSDNSGDDTAFGYHFGVLLQPTETTRLGVNFSSQVVHHLKGKSTFTGPLANDGTTGPDGVQTSNNLRANVTLPPAATFSVFHSINPQWDVMGTMIYTQWSTIQELILQNTAGVTGDTFSSTNTLPVVIHQRYRNTMNYSLGANYHVNDNFMIRFGGGYDESPSNNTYRNLQLPDSDRYALAIGGHYQATKALGFDLGWTHIFAKSAPINIRQVVGSEAVTTDGDVAAHADVYGLQVKWDIA